MKKQKIPNDRLQNMLKAAVISKDKDFISKSLRTALDDGKSYQHLALRLACEKDMNDIASWLLKNYTFKSKTRFIPRIKYAAREGKEELLIILIQHFTVYKLSESDLNDITHSAVHNAMEEAMFIMLHMKIFKDHLERLSENFIKQFFAKNNEKVWIAFKNAKERYRKECDEKKR